MSYTAPPNFSAGNVLTEAELDTLSDDITFLAHPPKCRIYNSANQNVLNTTDTALTFNSERFDTDTMHSTVTNTSRITFTTAGTYLVGGCVQWSNSASGYRILSIRKNGSTLIAIHSQQVRDDGYNDINVSTAYHFSAADYVELIATQNSGSTLTVNNAGENSPEFWAIWQSL